MLLSVFLWSAIFLVVAWIFLRESKQEAIDRSNDAFEEYFFCTEIQDQTISKNPNDKPEGEE